MKVIILLAIALLAHADWQDGWYYNYLWGGVRGEESYVMVTLNPSERSSQYGELWVTVKQPFVLFGEKDDYNYDQDRKFRGKRWTVEMGGTFYETADPTPGAGDVWSTSADLMRCMVCFDVKKEDAELKAGHKGIGSCVYKVNSVTYSDSNFFGTVEAQGSDSFRFADDTKNDWDTDSGYLDITSSQGTSSATFVSEPLDVNANSPRNLGI